MTKTEFYAAIEAKPNFVKWVSDEVTAEATGDVKKNFRQALITTPDGRNVIPVFSIEDIVTGEVTFQNIDTLTPEENTVVKKELALLNYLKANFFAYFMIRTDLDNSWAEVEVFTDGTQLTRSRILVYKKAGNPITHKTITP